MSKLTTIQKFLILVVLYVFLSKGGISRPTVPDKPVDPVAPFVVSDGKLTALLQYDASVTDSYPDWLVGNDPSTIEGWIKAHNGEWRRLDKAPDVQFLEDKWKAAVAVPKASFPWLVVSNGKRGFSIPITPSTTKDDVVARLQPLGN